MDLKTLKARWGWTTLFTFAVMAALGYVDMRVKAASGAGIMDLEAAATAVQVSAVTGAWQAAGVADEMGFLLGMDYLYMPLYGFSLFYGALAAREAFFKAGRLRKAVTVLAFAPLVGAGLDVFENYFEARMLFDGATEGLASAAYAFTLAKFAGVIVGLILALLGVAGLLMRRLRA